MGEFKRIARELVYEGSIINFCKDTVITPEGKEVKWDFIDHKGAAAIIPVCSNGNILMVKQYRNALDQYTLEIPAGGLNGNEEHTKIAALRELEEETGYRSNDAEFLLSIRTAVAFCNEKIDIYVATDLIKSEQNLDEDEFIEVYEFSVEDLLFKIFSGEIEDTKTISAILSYYCKYRNKSV